VVTEPAAVTEPAGVSAPLRRRDGVALRGNDWSVLDGRRPATPPSVSVIVAHYEQQAELDRTLLALRRQVHPADRLEVIVVDDGSAVPPRVPEGVTLIEQDDRGFRLAAARNAGARVATGRILVFLDADTVPSPSYVADLTRLPALAPDVVAVGRRRHADLAALDADQRVEEAAEAVALPSPAWLDHAYATSRNLLDADDRSYRFVIGAVIACDAEFFRETGGFDETFTEYGGEDWEWAARAWRHGGVLAHVPTAVAWHDGPEQSERSEATRARKNAEALRLARLVPTPGSGLRGLRSDAADLAIEAAAGVSDSTGAAWLVALDSAAADLPLAAVPGDGRSRERVRVTVRIQRPLLVSPGALAAALHRVDREGLGSLTIVGPDGAELALVQTARATARARRWGRDDLFDAVRERVPGVDPLPDDVDVEAYLGGWLRPTR
jgi:GT2 family glycosyltransferase